jgi:tRNA uridine 5-carboxymethylaminomethyl modification enzyme
VSRAQYPIVAQRKLRELDPEMIHEASVQSLWIEDGKAAGVITSSGEKLRAGAVIVCAGTFLNSVMHTGRTQEKGGRFGEQSATIRTQPEGALTLHTARLKTGTPPRISLRSIDTAGLEAQFGEPPIPFSTRTITPRANSIACWLTRTSSVTHRILEKGFADSPMFGGRIQGKGPRYCPSIEDKITRFAEKQEHHIFLEPEEEDGDLVYVNGFSTSLPADIQLEALRTLPGLERVAMIRPGYAVEYDYYPAYQLFHTLESKQVEHLYFAGQVNGTSGYEEAGAQGIVAGINAAAKLKNLPSFVVARDEGYIGVLVDDLINKVQEEPYRLFTSSAEHRLLLRQDNADQRLSLKAWDYGLISKVEWNAVQEKQRLLKLGMDWAETERAIVTDVPLVRESVKNRIRSKSGSFRSYLEAGQQSEVRDQLLQRPDVIELLEIEIAYEGYIRQHQQQISRVKESEQRGIPLNFDYSSLTALSREASDVLAKLKPSTLGQASRIPGVTPADLSILHIALRNNMFPVEQSN